MNRREIRIAGFGGQGVVLSGEILGRAVSIFGNGFATLTQSYGPEARGGSCTAELVISDEPVDYPYVTSPKTIIMLSQEAYNNFGQSPSKDTLLIIDPDLVKTAPSKRNGLLSIPANRMAKEMGRVVVANIIMLGFLAAVSDLTSPKALRDSILASVPEGTGDFNLKAFDLGYNYGLEHGERVNGTAS